MSKNKFLQLLERNFSPNDRIQIGENKKFQQNEKNPFARDFYTFNLKVSQLGEYLNNRMKKKGSFGDFYICFTPFKNERLKENAQDSYIIAMDIDGANIPNDLPPSYFWETSLNKYQGVWLLDNKVTPEEQEKLNKQLIAKYGFDKASADIVHFYRIPNTFNFKYATPFRVGSLQGDGTVYRKKDFVSKLKDVKVTNTVTNDNTPIEVNYDLDIDSVLLEFNVTNEFKQVLAIDRSEWAWNLEKKLIENGASKEVVKFVMLNAPKSMQKFDEKKLDKEINRVFAKVTSRLEDEEVIEPTKKLSGHDKGLASLKQLSKKGAKQVSQGIVIKSYKEIEEPDLKEAWLVEGIWANHSVGVIGAPSKSFKSTLTLNLACCVASGSPFDGRQVKQGGVLILQGENSLSMEKHKIQSITGLDDLPIYFVESFLTMEMIYKLKGFIEAKNVKLLIVDPMYLLFGSGDINKHQDIVQRLSILTKLRDETGCSVMLVHHSRKLEKGSKIQTSDMYGSAFIEGWYESMILLQRNGPTTSRMTTYFRNHKSGDKYTLLVDDNMRCKAIKDKGEDDWSEEAEFSQVKKKGGNE